MGFVKLKFHIGLTALSTVTPHLLLLIVFSMLCFSFTLTQFWDNNNIVIVLSVNLCKCILICKELKSMKNILEISFNTKTFLRYLHPRREDTRGVDVKFHLFL